MKLQKIKLVDIVNDKLTNEEIELLKGGDYAHGCSSVICKANIDDLSSYCTNGDGMCKSGVA